MRRSGGNQVPAARERSRQGTNSEVRFVCGWPVKRRYRTSVHSQINRELRAVIGTRWFMMKLRSTTLRRASEDIGLAAHQQRPHGRQLSSVACAMASRADARFDRTSPAARRGSSLPSFVAACPAGATNTPRSLSSLSRKSNSTCRPRAWPAIPSEPDFGCGFQPNLSSGTRSSVLRVPSISLSEFRE